MLLKDLKMQNRGNISFLAMAAVIIFSILFLLIFDLCHIFIAREETKNASDAVSLAVAQNLLFFEDSDCSEIAEEMARKNNCILIEYSYDYDNVIVTVEKTFNFVLIDRFSANISSIRSTSETKVIYPWDDRFGYCKTYKFGY
ncbi:MAG: Tad domain-containing protein [Actinomycetota bacterium]|jgi:uncharacterized membrane protein|nr:Tad domain-containing protein [Actinomycetota bacterium]